MSKKTKRKRIIPSSIENRNTDVILHSFGRISSKLLAGTSDYIGMGKGTAIITMPFPF